MENKYAVRNFCDKQVEINELIVSFVIDGNNLNICLCTFQIKCRVTDNSIGNVFGVTVADLNNDGKTDLLVTNNGEIGSLYAYEVPSNFRYNIYINCLTLKYL